VLWWEDILALNDCIRCSIGWIYVNEPITTSIVKADSVRRQGETETDGEIFRTRISGKRRVKGR
jgi:hypothetical protein